MAFPIGPVLGAGVGLADLLASSGYNNASVMLQYQQLALQREIARQQQRLATAAREDIYGNRTGYNELTNEFYTDLDPTQKAIINAQEREQLLNLTEDAQRNREIRRKAAGRARKAEGLYNQAISDYKYDAPPSEAALAADITKGNRIARRQGLDEGIAALTRQAIRSNNSGIVPQLLKQANDQFGGSLEAAIASGREQARQVKPQLDAAHRAGTLAPATQFQATASGERPTPLNESSLAYTTGQTQNQMIRDALNAISGGGYGVLNASNALASGLRNAAPDFSGLIRALSSIQFADPVKDESRLYDDTISKQPLKKGDPYFN